MLKVGRGTKIWVFASLCALLLWVVCMLPSSFRHLFNVILGQPDFYTGNLGMFIASHVGLLARFFAVILALASGFLLWSTNLNSYTRLTRLVETALFLEGTYYILLFPSGLWWVSLGFNFIGLEYLLRAILAGSALLMLSFKVQDFARGMNVLKWIGVAGVSYIVSLWFNVVFGWFDMIAVIGSGFLLTGAASWAFLVSLIAMSLGIVFAVAGAHLLAKNQGEATKWFGLSLAMIGLHYIVYLLYSFLSGNLDPAMAIDLWALPFLGLGITLFRTKAPKNIIDQNDSE